MMNKVIRILHLEDDPDYSVLVDMMLEKEEIPHELSLVSTRREFEQAVKTGQFDLVLADYVLPDYDGIQAARLARRKLPNVPFIIASGVLSEQAAVSSLKAGATDFVLKALPERLIPAIKRAINGQKDKARKSAEGQAPVVPDYFKTPTPTALDIPDSQTDRRSGQDARQSAPGGGLEGPDKTPECLPVAVSSSSGAMVQSEERFRAFFEASPDPTFIQDCKGTVLDANPAACRLHGMAREQLIGKRVADLVPPDLAEQVTQQFQEMVEGRISRVEAFCWTAEKQAIPVEVRASRIEYASQPAMLLHVRDITDQKQAEAALRSSEMLFHSVWENAVTGMRLTNSKGLIVAVNEAFCSLVGLARHQLEGKPLSVIYAEGTAPDPNLQEYQKQFQNRVIDRCVERQMALRSGKVVTLEDTTSFVEVRGQMPLLLAWSRDVTAQKQLEEQFRHSQKMEALGQLAGGVAHDFNNLLTVIHGHASLLQAAGALSGPCARSAQQIVEATERASRLTRQLLTFSRRQVMQPRRLDLNEVVTNMTRMLARILGEDIALRVHYFPQPALVWADAGMMEQVVLNLAVNSRDAMPRGGSMTVQITVEDVTPKPDQESLEIRPSRCVCLAVQDTGCGIAPENLQRIFEPFFTTKEIGKGTGIGLATVYGIVNQHKGWITADSSPGNGATFKMFLPCSMGNSDSPEDKPDLQPARGGTETILVVEDEAAVRELVCNLLSGQGYRILEAESGSKAMEVWRNSNQKVDLLLTDLVMPDRINGRELAERLWMERPELKVLFTSGYSAEVVGKDFVLGRNLNYLQKPYHPQRLAVTVRECLDARN